MEWPEKIQDRTSADSGPTQAIRNQSEKIGAGRGKDKTIAESPNKVGKGEADYFGGFEQAAGLG